MTGRQEEGEESEGMWRKGRGNKEREKGWKGGEKMHNQAEKSFSDRIADCIRKMCFYKYITIAPVFFLPGSKH